ncbi:NADH-quinone oxidoreductase subunit B family protein [Arundinibacter roseus]|uniref:Hydrogenase n=1 Tax=Arundinibacter roseus TaxID=2070510 RepID=A0A4R4JZN8_9BACT|nr:hydrogenase [Arundinibacter roseus]TDB60384.1 hydrogenase [Arundinibacter roseus]
MANVLWLQGGACSGNTMSFLNAEEPTVIDLVTDFGVNILWHPSIGLEIGEQVTQLLRDIIAGTVVCDILVYEGSIIEGPHGTGTMNYFCDRPMKDWVKELAAVSGFVVAIGDCATWGGIPAVEPNPSESTGMQFLKKEKGGFLGAGYTSKGGLPVINIPGCPAHPDWITQILVAISTGRIGDVLLDEYHRPKTFFTDFVQTGCTNVVNFANKIDGGFGKRGNGCLFYEVGCRGPMTRASCNRILWNRHSSKTRANHPCLGCTEPGFPHNDLVKGSIFKTMKYLGVLPQEVPSGNSKLGYYMRAGFEKTMHALEVAVGVEKSHSDGSK